MVWSALSTVILCFAISSQWHEPTCFCFFTVKSEPAWLRTQELRFEAEKDFCCINIDRPPIQGVQIEIFSHVQTICIFAGCPLCHLRVKSQALLPAEYAQLCHHGNVLLHYSQLCVHGMDGQTISFWWLLRWCSWLALFHVELFVKLFNVKLVFLFCFVLKCSHFALF